MVRESFWFGGASTLSSIDSSGTLLLTQSSAGALELTPFTVIRTRGIITLRSDQIAVSEDQSVSYGHAVVSTQAVAIGISAIPTPITDR